MSNPSPNMSGLKAFKPGQSGNPKGRKKGVPTFTTCLKKILAQKTKQIDPITGKKIKMSGYEKLMWKLFALAGNKSMTNKDIKAIEMIMDRIEGKAIQKTEITGADGDALAIKEISSSMTDKEATEIFLNEIKNPDISKAMAAKNEKSNS